MAKKRVFLDSSILITALLSSHGGSFFILTQYKDKFEFLINEYVLEETIKVIESKFRSRKDLKTNLFFLIGFAKIKIVSDPSHKEIGYLKKVIKEKDAPILASALKHTRFLLTLDNDFFDKKVLQIASKRGLIILKPKDFFEKFKNLN